MPAYARTATLAGLTSAVLAVLGGAQPYAHRPGGTAPGATGGPAPVAADGFRSVRTYPVVAPPVRLRIRALRVDSPLQRLGLRPDGTVEVPARPDVAGWYERGPRPGQPGPAVVLGHVDSRTGPGVFARLRTVRPGTLIGVDRADGSKVTFRVTRVAQTSKTAFPTDLVYAPTLDATLRLVTCGGSFDRDRGSYRDNVIVFADEA
ncbi:class F sortase [Actinoplanes sp. NPDC049316]|uniref:class F sortase n=1 Tax=Actinoplanes sp. NPDC049316 TaxID=3154727 RepID=UPI00343D7565